MKASCSSPFVSMWLRLVAILVLVMAGTVANAQTPMSNGTTYNGLIAPAGSTQSWTFSATSGQAIVIRVGIIAGTNSFAPVITLYNPSSTVQATAAGGSVAEIAVTATNTGTFTIVVNDVHGTGTGAYLLVFAESGVPAVIPPGQQGGPLTNGSTYAGSIALGGLQAWTISATNGQTIIVGMGHATNSESLSPYLRLFDPSGAQLTSDGGPAAAEMFFRATNTGTFTVVATDGSSFYSGHGPYQLSLAQTGPPVVISPGQSGGPLTNGSTFTGTIGLGLLNVWTLSATNGQTIIVGMGRTTNTLSPWLGLYDPSGVQLTSYGGPGAAEVFFRATNTGTFTVVAGDGSSYYSGSGSYQLTLAQTGSPIFISAGQQGGMLTGVETYNGTISLGELDEWTFTACAGTPISLQMTKATNTSLTPTIRLYDRTGNQVDSAAGPSTALLNTNAPSTGLYTVVLSDGSSYYSGSGDYTFTVNGLSSGLKLCEPIVSGTNVHVSGVGGTNSGTFEILAATNVATARALWTPVLTNQFDTFGTFTFSNLVDPAYNQRFFLIREP